MLVAIIGDLGSGKTLTLTFFGYFFYQKGITIYSNYKLSFPHIYISNPRQLESIKKGIFLGDELWLWLESRTSQSHVNKFVTHILAKSRKRGYDVFYTTQTFTQIDVRIRKLTDLVMTPQFNERTKKCTVTIMDRMGNAKYFTFNAEPLFEMYDTTEEIESYDGENMLDELLQLIKRDNQIKKLRSKQSKVAYIKLKYKVPLYVAKLVLELI